MAWGSTARAIITMAADRADRDQRPSPEALLEAVTARGPRAAEDLPRRRAGGRQDLRDAASRRRPSGARASMSSSASSRRMARRETEALLDGLEIIPRPQRRLQGPRARRDGSRRHPDAPPASWCWSTSSRTPTPPAAAIPSAISMSRSCSPPASTSTRRSTSSMSRASTTSSRRSPASACARPCPTASSTAPTTSRSSISAPEDLIQRLQRGQGLRAAAGRARGPPLLLSPAT